MIAELEATLAARIREREGVEHDGAPLELLHRSLALVRRDRDAGISAELRTIMLRGLPP